MEKPIREVGEPEKNIRPCRVKTKLTTNAAGRAGRQK